MSEKWWDMSDDELDDLFRDASDKVEVPFDSSAYNKLRQKIAEQPMSEPPKGFKKRWLLLLAGLILLVGVGLVYRFGNKKVNLSNNNQTEIVGNIEKKNTVKPLNIPSSVPSGISQNKDSELSMPLPVSPQTTQNNLELSSVKTQTIDKVKESKASLFVDGKTISKQNLKSTSVRTQTTAKENLEKPSVGITVTHSQTVAKENLGKSSVNTGTHSQTTVDNDQQKPNENIYTNSNITENQLVTNKNSKIHKDKNSKNYISNSIIIEQNNLPILENSSITQDKIVSDEAVNKTNFYDVDFLKNKDSKSLLTDIHPELPTYVDSLPRIMKPVKLSKFGIRLALSPDFNSIENLGTSALGGSVGLLFEYKLSKKLILQTGITYSNKSYIGSFDDYHNWKEWKGYHPSKPTEVDGGCKILDIPINLRINLFQKPKQTWFVSSGVSSYWMLNENYTYLYDWSPPKAVDWSDNSKYYWGVLNFSVGLERQISKHLSLQIEPYLKTPLKSVGRGGVNLYSSGVLFSTKYDF